MSFQSRWQEVFSQGREDVDQHDFLVQHRRAVLDAAWQMQQIAGLEHAVVTFDGVAHATALHHRDLLVRMRMNRRHRMRGNAQPAHHDSIAPEELTFDAFGDPLGGNRAPVTLPGDENRVACAHFLSALPASRPDGVVANSGCTLTTPYWRSSFSRLAAIIHRKLIG